jgi:hypothetical protein
MKMRDTNETNFFAKVTPEEFEDEFLGLEELNRSIANEATEELTEVEKELLNEPTTIG